MKRWLAVLALASLAGNALAIVNVNTAQQSELQKTRGLDRQKAKAIIEYRAENGKFDSIDELEKVPGITSDVVARAGGELALDGPPFKPSKATAKPAAGEKGKKKD